MDETETTEDKGAFLVSKMIKRHLMRINKPLLRSFIVREENVRFQDERRHNIRIKSLYDWVVLIHVHNNVDTVASIFVHSASRFAFYCFKCI